MASRADGLLGAVKSFLSSDSYNSTRLSTEHDDDEEVEEDESEDAPSAFRPVESRRERVFGLDVSGGDLAQELEAVLNESSGDGVPIRPEPRRAESGMELSIADLTPSAAQADGSGADPSEPIVIDGEASTTGAMASTSTPPVDKNLEVVQIEQTPFHMLLKTKRQASSDFLSDVATNVINVSSGLFLRSAKTWLCFFRDQTQISMESLLW